ncbi:gibberellin 3-beta-dioxygenase 1 [Dorcoceras hygrometricum]|uniref:gibberellin 3beta-dioxygenase n=1 Tax=Dorcoceras hygrometricum TaxID=472368 RepID=A0A2Z7DAH0_9LAMI|nr:gibberellin 3-beta-dioxygenase 1 [Dorcoceras hygrometricum]
MTSKGLADAFRAHTLNLHHKIVDFNALNSIPESHAWKPQGFDHYPTRGGDPEAVPIIDLTEENAPELIGHACKKWGVFQVINHNISKSLLDDVEMEGKRLFSLPMDQKLKAARLPNGVSGYGVVRISRFFPKCMWSEGFTIADSMVEHASQLWPNNYQKFCDTIEECKKEMNNLAHRLMWLMLGSLGITQKDIEWAGPNGKVEGGDDALQMNSYPACPDPDRVMGLAAHTDSTILSIIHQSNTSGLQLIREGGSVWITVPPHPGALVIHVGDLMHILSNGLYPSVLHRAIVNRTQHRLSVAYFFGPPVSVKVSPIKKLVDECHPQLYRPITWSEYLGIKSELFDKGLPSLRLCSSQSRFTDVNGDDY